jgi:hypothetical protein
VTVTAGLGCLEGIMMISETTVMMLIAIQFGFMAFVLMKLDLKKGESERLKSEIEKSLSSITMPDFKFDELKGELVELVEDLLAQMRIPTIADHLGGIASGFMQMKMQKLQNEMGGLIQPQEEPFENEDF